LILHICLSKFLQCSYWHLVRPCKEWTVHNNFAYNVCIKWIDSMIDSWESSLKALHNNPIALQCSMGLSEQQKHNWLNLHLLCQLNGNCIHQCHLQIHHSYRFFLKWVHDCCKAKQSKAALASVCKFSPLSLLTPFTYYRCANSEPITAAGRLKINSSWVIFSRCESHKLRILLYKSLTFIFVEVNTYLVRLKLGI
jgi:hypothetical protein